MTTFELKPKRIQPLHRWSIHGCITLFNTESNCRLVLFNLKGCVHLCNCSYLDHLRHVALRPSVFRGIFHFDKDDKEEVVPHVVLLFDVLLESHRLVVKLVPLEAYNAGGETKCELQTGKKRDLCFNKRTPPSNTKVLQCITLRVVDRNEITKQFEATVSCEIIQATGICSQTLGLT